MDNEVGESAPVGRKIALGLSDYIFQFAARWNAEIWVEFASEDLLQWKYYLLELADDPGTTIYFNLHGIDVQLGLMRAATGRATPTDWELFQIHEHESWWPRIAWWDHETPASNPFDRGPGP
jgi:hypothetical protein